jgi:hypothetical protein
MAFQLAQINIGRLVAPIDDPRLADFVAQLDPVNRRGSGPRLCLAPSIGFRQRHRCGIQRPSTFDREHVSMGVSGGASRLHLRLAPHTGLSRAREMVRENGPAELLPVVGSGGTPAHGSRRQRAAGALSGTRRDGVRLLVFAELSRAHRPGHVRLNSPRR